MRTEHIPSQHTNITVIHYQEWDRADPLFLAAILGYEGNIVRVIDLGMVCV